MIKVSLTEIEHKAMEELRSKLALLGFGVTYMDGKITLRWSDKAITFIPERIFLPETEKDCYLCGGKDQLMPAKVTVDQGNDGEIISYDSYTCTWCRCPQ